MNNLSYTNLIDKTFSLYMQGQYKEAYEFITENSPGVNGNFAQIFNFRYCIAMKAGFANLALELMQEAIVERGFWYSYEYLMQEEDLEPLRSNKQFLELTEICRQREAQALENAKSELKLIEASPLNGEKKPLIFALHGNQQNIEITKEHWNSAVALGYTLALPQSSSIEFFDAFVWNDSAKGAEELQQHYRFIQDHNSIDESQIIVGGFSAGSRTSLYAALEGLIPARGLILVGPWLPEIEAWEEKLNNLKAQGMKVYIICGDKDEDCYECTMKLIEFLKEKDIAHKYIILKGLEHQYPEHFKTYLKDALEYIAGAE